MNPKRPAKVRTCWGVGRHILEFEQGGAARAENGAKLLPQLAEKLTEEFECGFSCFRFWTRCVQHLERTAFRICDALRHERKTGRARE